MFNFSKKKVKESCPVGEMIADRLAALTPETIEKLEKLSKLDPLLNIADGKEITIDKTSGAVSVTAKA